MSIIDNIIKSELIDKGWSTDKKYLVQTEDGTHLLLRVADISQYNRKKAEFDMIERIATLGFSMSQPIEFGTMDDGKSVYQLLSWCEGEDAESILPHLTEAEQYALGLEAGRILKKIHEMETLPASVDWRESYIRKLDGYIEGYENCGMTFEGDAQFLEYIQRNRHLVENRIVHPCYTHGDFHVGNLVVSPNQGLSVIDFQRCGIGDPYHAFVSIMFSVNISPRFSTGQIHGYFDGNPPADFWELLTFYIVAVQIHALPWSIPFGQIEIDFAHKMIDNVLVWYDQMQNVVPSWYFPDSATKKERDPMQLELFINFNGNCREAVEFYAEVFKTPIGNLMTYGDAPPDLDNPVSEADMGRIMYAGIPFGNMVAMFMDVPSGAPFIVGNNISPTFSTDDKDEVVRLFEALSEGGSVDMELAPTFFSELYGCVTDRFGVVWQVLYYQKP